MTEICATTSDNLGAVCVFLHENLNQKICVEDWKIALTQKWSEEVPNHGFHLISEGNVVGVIGAIYSDQLRKGSIERFCNITSWCVLPDHRRMSMKLALAVVGQKGYHFTDLTPSDIVVDSLKFLNFKCMTSGYSFMPAIPLQLPAKGSSVLTEADKIEKSLDAETTRIYQDHKSSCPWFEFIAVKSAMGSCLVAFRRTKIQKLGAVEIIYISDAEVFEKNMSVISLHFLSKRLVFILKIESRFLNNPPKMTMHSPESPIKMFKSDSIPESEINNLYTEIFSLEM